MKDLSRLLRLSHWSKSAFVLLGPIYAGQLGYLISALEAAFCFSLIASAVYIYNDIQDKDEDRVHPEKRYRPIASGAISIQVASLICMLLLVITFVLAYFISIELAAILATYLVVNLIYNHSFREIAILDVLCIAIGFFLRALAGTIGIGLTPSYWLLLTVMLISLYIALCKRRLEKQGEHFSNARHVLKKYTSRLLNRLIMTVGILTFTTYLLYIIAVHYQSFYFLLTLPFAFIGLWRFALITTPRQIDDDPIALFFNDRLSCINLLCFFALTFIALFA